MLTLINDPLEQFEVLNIFSYVNLLSLTNLAIILFFNLLLYTIFCALYLRKEYTNYHFIFDCIFKLIKNIVRENLTIKKNMYFTVLFYLFFIILLSNLVGMIPYSFTVTSSFIVTFFLASMHFIGINLIGITQSQ
jgi:F-type H+-transporting ATPase subunit a